MVYCDMVDKTELSAQEFEDELKSRAKSLEEEGK